MQSTQVPLIDSLTAALLKGGAAKVILKDTSAGTEITVKPWLTWEEAASLLGCRRSKFFSLTVRKRGKGNEPYHIDDVRALIDP